MAQKPFGRILADARERQGIDINYAAQQLRIRADILRAIEQNDFSRMPARGYTRNMVSAYARLLGLNAPSIMRQYLDEADEYQHSRRGGYDDGSRSRSRQYSGSSRSSRGTSSGSYGSTGSRAVRNARGRDVYSDRDERMSRPSNRRVSYQEQPRSIRSGRSGRSGGYSGGYAASAPNPILSRLPLILGAIVAVVLVVFIVTQIIGCVAPKSNDNVTSIPITGVSDTTNSNSNENANTSNASTASVESAPTSVTVSYTVPSGSSTYVEVYENGESVASEYGIVTGPSTAQYNVTNSLEIHAVDSSQIQIKVDNADAAMTYDSSLGVYTYTLSFADYLNDWAKNKKSTSNTTNTNKNTNSSNTNSSSSTTNNTNSR